MTDCENMATNIPFERLRGRENFDIWKRHAKSYLVLKSVWKVVDKGLTSEASEKDQENDERALALITLMVEPVIFSHIATAEKSKEAWDAIIKSFDDSGLTRKVDLLKQLVQLKLSDCESTQDYVNQMVMTSLKVKNAGLNIDDELTASLMLAGLPDDFRALVMAVENTKTKLTIDAVKTLLLQDIKFDGKSTDSALYSKNKKSGNVEVKFRCHTCNEPNHLSRNCPTRSKKNGKRDITKKDSVLYASLLVNDNSASDWFVDSGATAHMTNNKNSLFNKISVSNKEVVVANNTKIPIECAGEIKLSCSAGKQKVNATVKNVEHVPNLCANLLSVRQMTKNGNKVVFENDDCKIFNNERKLIATADAVNDLYRLNCSQINDPNKCETAMTATSDSSLWHRRLGHICNENLNKVQRASIGVKFTSNSNQKCIVCVQGKQSRAPFNEIGKRAENLLDLIHSDVLGPLKIKSTGGARFLVTFIDDYSRKVFLIPIKQKSDVFSEFVKFKNLVENQCSRKIKVFRSDNGTEYVNKQFEKLFEKCGIVHQKTTPYTPQQNGVSERMNRTIIERVRCMLTDAKMSPKFWAEAAVTATYLQNRVPCRGNSRCPEEIWTNEKPNLEHLRVFGCKAMVHVPQEKRTKLDIKSTECIFFGYSTESKAYRMYNPKTKKIVTSRDVIFIENNTEVTENNSFGTNCSLSPIVDLIDDDMDSETDNSGANGVSELPVEESPPEEPFENSLLENTVQLAEDDLGEMGESTLLDLGELDTSSEYDSANDHTYAPEVDITTNESEEVRRSERIPTLPKPSYTFCASSIPTIDPTTVREAMARPDAHLWKAAMQEEIESLTTNSTWSLTELPAGKRAIGSKWVFKVKRNTDGEIVRHKARLVAKGFNQQKGIDYDETYAPVVRYTSIRFLLAMAVKYDLAIYQMDAVTAYLNGDLNERIYMSQPIGYDDNSGRVCRLRKSIYGLKQSGRAWNEKLNRVLIDIGLKRGDVDQCIYHRISENKMIFLTIYVDDVLIFTNDIDQLNHVKRELSKNFKMTDMGIATSILGIRLTRDATKHTITIDQSQYIADVLERFGMDQSKPISTPVDTNQQVSAKMCPSTENDVQEMSKIPYMQAIGSLLFAAQITRPDICFAVNLLSRYGANPGKAHWTAVKRVMRYLKGTINKGLTYTKDDSEVTGFCDADWASDLDQRRSTTGYVFKFQGGAISWATKRQKTVALSTTESELMSMVAAIQESIWLKRFECELLPKSPKSIVLNCDNKSAIDFANNNSHSQRTKHIDIKDKFVRQNLNKRLIKLNYIPTDTMLADILTKGVNAIKHEKLTNEFGLATKQSHN